LKILVCLKQVIDVELNVQLRDGRIVEEGLQYAMNAYDESALEAALQLKDKNDLEVTVLSMGPDRVTDVLKKALAMGADRAVHLADPAFAGGDSGAAAQAIAAFARDKGFDLILMGRQAQDTDAAGAGPMVAEFLGLPQVTNVVSLEQESDNQFLTRRVGDDGREVVSVQTPAVITVSNDFGEARLPTMKGILGAKKKPLDTVSPAEIGLNSALLGAAGSKTQVVGRERPQGRAAGRKLTGETPDLAKQLVGFLVDEARVLA